MQIKNPSNNAINDIRIFGVLYSIEAEGTLDNVPEEHARYWQETIHKFLILRKDRLEAKPETIEVPTPKVEEVKPEVVEAPIEAPTATVIEEVKKEEVSVVAEKPKAKPATVKKVK